MAIAAIYTRLSQDREGTKGGTDRQEKDCRALCRREGLKVAKVFTDDDRSAYNGKTRPGFEAMLTDLDRFDVVVFWKTDRLVRRFTQFARVLEACEKAKVRLVSVLDPIDTSTPILQGVAGLMASMGEQESKNISIRVSRLHEDLARKGLPSGHRRALGYEPDGMTVVKSEAKAIREARDRILRGESMTSICDDWNRRGIKPTTAPAWRVTTFKKMIAGPRIAGLRRYQGEVIGKAAWPAIISEDDHARIVRAVEHAKRGRPATYLLSGIIHCGRCDAVLRAAVRGDGTKRWACQRVPGDDSHCGQLTVVADPVNELVEEAILYRLDSPAVRRAMKRPKTKAGNVTASEVADLEARLVQLGVDHDEDVISRKEWLDRRGKLADRLESARADLARENDTTPLAPFANGDVAKHWARLSLVEQRRVVAVLIDRVVVHATDKRGNTFDPDRVDVVWRV